MGFVRLIGLTGLCLLAAACASKEGPPPPKIYNLEVGPTKINPGETVVFRFAMDYSGPWSDIISIKLEGLPRNTLAAGTDRTIALPAGSGEASETVVHIKAPARHGTYPLSMRVTVEDSPGVIIKGIGPLIVNDVPGQLDFADFEPSSHKIDRCRGSLRTVTIKVLARDDNGADDIVRPRVTRIDPAVGLAVAPLPIVLNETNSRNTVEELVETPVEVRCKAPAPQVWRWAVRATDVDGEDGPGRLTNTATAQYFTNR